MKMRIIIVVGLALVSLYLVYCSQTSTPSVIDSVKIHVLIQQLKSAQTPEEEVEACYQINTHEYWYSVETRDADGSKTYPENDGQFGQVATIKITFRDGQWVEHEVLEPKSIRCLYHE